MDIPDPLALDALMARAQSGDADAFGDLVEALHREVRCFIAARSVDLDLVEEVVQAAFVLAWERRADYRLEGTLLPWMKGIARHRLREELRHRARRAELDASDVIGLAAADAGADLDESWDASLLPRCLEQLQHELRRLIDRHYRDGIALAELARLDGVSAGTLASKLFRVRRALRACIERGGTMP